MNTLPDNDGFYRRTECLLCGSGDVRPSYPQHLPWVFRCRKCGLGFTNPQPSDNELATIYNDEYYQAFGYTDADSAGYRLMNHARHEGLLRLAERHIGVGRLLDAGSALGNLLGAATARGWRAHGIEPNAFACERANRSLPGATWHGKMEDYPLSDQPFDLVTCLDVVEHLRRPDHFFASATGWLRRGGLVLLTTVNEQSLPARLMGHRWFHYHRDHLWYFTPRTLRAFAEAAGLRVLRCVTARKAFNLLYILEILSHGSDTTFARRLTRWGLERLPNALLKRVFSFQEGLLLMAHKP